MTWPPKKLPKGFPLTVTQKGYVKTIGGRTRWIAARVTPQEAMAAYHRKAASIAAKTRPIPVVRADRIGGSIAVNHLINRYLQQRQRDVDAGDLRVKSYIAIRRACKLIDSITGTIQTGEWTADTTQQLYDQLRKAVGVSMAKRYVSMFSTICTYGEDRNWCDTVRIGRRMLRKLTADNKAKKSWHLYDVDELHQIIGKAYERAHEAKPGYRPGNIQLLAMIVLALNGGLGAAELAALRRSSVKLAAATIDQPRGKTGAEHFVPLWPETVNLLRLCVAIRPGDDLMFRTRYGRPWLQESPVVTNGRITGVNRIDSIGERFSELIAELGLSREGVGFYKLKHVHATAADKAGDPHATFVLSGHKLPGARSHYVDVGVDRVRKVVEFVREHLGINRLACLEPASIERLGRPPASIAAAAPDQSDDTACESAAG